MNYSDLLGFTDLQFMPVLENKKPIEVGWQNTPKKYNLKNCKAVGLVCGKLSANENGAGLEVIDIDCKYDLTGKLFDNYKRLINEANKTLLKKLVVQSTKGGGFHFIYRCSVIEGNLKLAQRAISEAERKVEFDILKKELPNEKDEVLLKRISKVKVLLETRGEGGYVVCFPSKGYELIYGDFYGIKEITPDERETLFCIARQFNEIEEEYQPKKHTASVKVKGTSPFEDYNERGDVVALLQKHGWTPVKNQGQKVLFKRPGQTSSSHSGNYDYQRKWFSVFTTSSEFEPMRSYLPYAVYAVLECNKDFTKASQMLYDEGYGDRREKQREINEPIPSRVSTIDDDYSFVATDADYGTYLDQVRDGTLPMGLTTGMEEVDKYFLFKQANFVMINGVDNTGKTAFILWLAMVSAILHDWKWIIYASENSLGSVMRRLIEYYYGRRLKKLNDMEYKVAKNFVESHFTLIKTDEQLHNYRDIINMTKKLLKRQQYNSVFIDPYNSLKIEMNNASRLSTHEFHYEAISEIKMYGKKYNIGFWINNHAVTSALRTKDDDGYTKAPGKEDTEGGGKFSNKADDFLTIHRHTQHPTEWMITEVHVRKIKETETGGRVTPKLNPLKFKMNETGCGFTGFSILGVEKDPIEQFHYKNGKPIQSTLQMPPRETLWTPYIDDGTPDTF